MDKHETEVCGCGKNGCLEQYASANGIVRMTKKALATETRDTILNTIENLTAKDIFDAAKSNDTVAVEQVEKMGNILGTALASIACVINPERIVIGGGVSKAGKILIDVIEKHFMGAERSTPAEMQSLPLRSLEMMPVFTEEPA